MYVPVRPVTLAVAAPMFVESCVMSTGMFVDCCPTVQLEKPQPLSRFVTATVYEPATFAGDELHAETTRRRRAVRIDG
jgi:hypothetical protein